jgi:hypothetical protein
MFCEVHYNSFINFNKTDKMIASHENNCLNRVLISLLCKMNFNKLRDKKVKKTGQFT